MTGKQRNWHNWFTTVWQNVSGRHRVLADYASLGKQHPDFLRDLALRGNVFDDSDPPTDPVALGIYLGRRQIALETLKLCKKTPQELFGYMSAKEKP